MEKKRSVGIIILGVYHLLGGTIFLLTGASWFFGLHPERTGSVLFSAGILLIAFYNLAVGIGVLTLKNWARLLIFIYNSATVILVCIGWLVGFPFNLVNMLILACNKARSAG